MIICVPSSALSGLRPALRLAGPARRLSGVQGHRAMAGPEPADEGVPRPFGHPRQPVVPPRAGGNGNGLAAALQELPRALAVPPGTGLRAGHHSEQRRSFAVIAHWLASGRWKDTPRSPSFRYADAVLASRRSRRCPDLGVTPRQPTRPRKSPAQVTADVSRSSNRTPNKDLPSVTGHGSG